MNLMQELDLRGMCIRFDGMCLGIWIRGFEDFRFEGFGFGEKNYEEFDLGFWI